MNNQPKHKLLFVNKTYDCLWLNQGSISSTSVFELTKLLFRSEEASSIKQMIGSSFIIPTYYKIRK